MNTLYVTVGLPRSGKSTWARQQRVPIVNPDSIRLALHGQRFYPPAEPFVWAMADLMVRALFIAGHNKVILDATNTTKSRRDKWLSVKWTTCYVLFGTEKEECIRRAGDDSGLIKVIELMHAGAERMELTENWILPKPITRRRLRRT